MSDTGPRIFRSLETSAALDSFDTIVRAALASFAALSRPTEAQARDFARLVLPLLDKVSHETRRVLAASLADAPRLPRALVERLLAEPIAVCAPFCLSSPLLSEADLATLAAREQAAARIVDARRRSTVDRSAAPLPRETEAPAAPTPPAAVAVPAASILPAREETMETRQSPKLDDLLRRVGQAAARRSGPGVPGGGDRLMQQALSRDRAGFLRTLAATLDLSAVGREAVAADATAAELCAALKAAGIKRTDALTMLMMLEPGLGTNVAAFEAMERRFDALDAETCAARFAAPRPAPLFVDTAPPHRPAANRVFGRRTGTIGRTNRRQAED